MMHNPNLSCLNAPIDFPPFSITASFPLKTSTSVLMISRVLTQQHTLVSYRLLRFLLTSSPPQYAPISTSLSPSLPPSHSFQNPL
ncbi:unnamed protein product [Hymenolepis diminuta]|uniref:Uncharacterized protein n=1 Tax=Hymenolepis diminuta TaxID=6216 RepID=A0A564YB88_HYMDI|nr:unnamed protein product [Hymenolepis diminuta]VUZ44476.1 unnamed protein product [Hymenolepis diminuta]VUZ44477.1 unnamed protein product [Hymenolepis diminuta]